MRCQARAVIYVLNEWIFHDLFGEHGKKAQQETSEFLWALCESDDKLVLPDEKRWLAKVLDLRASEQVSLIELAGQFISLLFTEGRTLDTRGSNPSIPEELYPQIPRKDVYLVRAYLASRADMLVTKDQPLHTVLDGSGLISCQMRDPFLSEYRAQADRSDSSNQRG